VIAEITRWLGSTRLARWLAALQRSEASLSRRAVRGGVWVFALRAATRGVTFVRTVLLARLLAPADFGLMGVAMLTLSILQRFSETGVGRALIQGKGDEAEYLDAAWTVQVARGIVLTAVLVLGAPLVGLFFDEPRAVPLVRALALSVLAGSVANIAIVQFTKELDFRKYFTYHLAGTLADLLVVVPLAFLLRNVWALVCGVLAKAMVQLVLSYGIHQYRPSLRIDWPRTSELLRFGRWILGSSVVVFLLTQGDDMLLAKLLGASALGLYQMAYRISNAPATEISHTGYQITFPTFSRLKDDPARLRRAFTASIKLIAMASLPLAMGIAAAAPDFVGVFLGQQWLGIIPTIQILAAYGAMRSISYGTLFQGVGRPQLQAGISTAKLALLAAIIYPLTKRWGVNGTALAVVLSDFPLKVLATKKALDITLVSWSQLLEILAMSVFAGLPMVGTMLVLRGLLPSPAGSVLVMLSGAPAYVLGLLLMDSIHPGYGLKELLRKVWRSLL
jgi:O-antigen/teichoic acid export membrane protein